MLDRYNIVNEGDLRDAAKRLDEAFGPRRSVMRINKELAGSERTHSRPALPHPSIPRSAPESNRGRVWGVDNGTKPADRSGLCSAVIAVT
jgi:hypothetical protein